MASNRQCHKCGWLWELPAQPGRSETCQQCRADMRVCKNCTFYDTSYAHQCKERRAEPVMDKEHANFCEWFEFSDRSVKSNDSGLSREEQARQDLKNLLGDL